MYVTFKVLQIKNVKHLLINISVNWLHDIQKCAAVVAKQKRREHKLSDLHIPAPAPNS